MTKLLLAFFHAAKVHIADNTLRADDDGPLAAAESDMHSSSSRPARRTGVALALERVQSSDLGDEPAGWRRKTHGACYRRRVRPGAVCRYARCGEG